MKARLLFPLTTIAALALAAAAPAQRGGGGSHGGGGGGGGSAPSRSSGGGGGPSRSGGDSRPSGSSGDSRPSRGGGDSRPSRDDSSSRPRGDDRSSRSDVRSYRGDSSSGRSLFPSSSSSRSYGGGDSRPSRSGGDVRSSDNGARRSPFDREIGRSDLGRSGGGAGRSYSSFQNGAGNRSYAGYGDRPSRGGTGSYGTRSNGYGYAPPTRYNGGYNHSVLGVQINRNQPRLGVGVTFVNGGVYGGLRYGYVGYNSFWNDDFFGYPYYVFNPWAPGIACVASPWYAYSYLPPYIDSSRVTVVNNYYSDRDADDWRTYDYRTDDNGGRNEELNDSLDNIRDAFERMSSRYGERLLPKSGKVAIFNEGKYDYSLEASDFADMYLDGIEKSKTAKYEILETRTRGDEVRVRARHEYQDSWGKDQTVFHTYTLRREEGGHYVIREFGTE